HRQAAHVRRSGEPGQIAHDAAADGDDRRVAIEPVGNEPVPQALGFPEALALLALGHDEDGGLEAGAPEAGRDPRREGLAGGLRDHRSAAPEPQPGACRPGRVEETRSDLDRVAPGPEVHHDLPHRLASLYLAKKKNRWRSDFGYVLDASRRVPTRFS